MDDLTNSENRRSAVVEPDSASSKGVVSILWRGVYYKLFAGIHIQASHAVCAEIYVDLTTEVLKKIEKKYKYIIRRKNNSTFS